MSKKIYQETRKLWKERITNWQASGKSGLSWCKENNIPEKSFYRWKGFFTKQENLKENSFIEISKSIELQIEYKDYHFKLNNFDMRAIVPILNFLKSL